MKKTLFIFAFLLNLIVTSISYASIEKTDLQIKLQLMCDKDQEIRELWVNHRGLESEQEYIDLMLLIDSENEKSVELIIQTYGWPGYNLVGKEGSNNMWALVQHLSNFELQKQCLILLEEAVKKNDADPINLAYLKDRVLMHEGKKQIYGTQLIIKDNQLEFYPIEDVEHVNERRLKIGMRSLEEYLERVREAYKMS
jgi:hypothetical protein